MTPPFPLPRIAPLERLQPSDGLAINADRWRLAHEYHRQRQNIHHQSLHLPGVVCGLGVRVIPAPANVAARDRDRHWVEIQPGMAIDLVGNPIVVSQPLAFHFNTEVSGSDSTVVYLVLSYVDPDELKRKVRGEIVRETFRVDEKVSPPQAMEVELCRVVLGAGKVELSLPKDVFFPGYNEIDLRKRVCARARPLATVSMAQVNHKDPECNRSFSNLLYLLRAVDALYPALQGASDLGQVTLEPSDEEIEADAYDLLYLTGKQALQLNSREIVALQKYLDAGGVLMVDVPLNAEPLVDSVKSIARQLQRSLKPLEDLRRDHPLRTQPFLFSALPTLESVRVQVETGDGIILVRGDLATFWGPDKSYSLPRSTIRTAHELGINILHYAWRRRQLTESQKLTSSHA